VAWADETRTFQVDFEDTQANNYNRYGASGHEWSSGGRADWTFDLTDEPTRYTFDVVFDQMVETTVQLVTFQLGLSGVQVYLDSIILVSEDDLGHITDYLPVEAIQVSSEDNVTRVEVGGTLQMSAEVFPAEADYPAVKWSVINGTGEATIDGNGLLTGVTLGSVTVVASAVDDSNQSGEKTINVSWPTGVTHSSVSYIRIYPNPAMNELNVVLGRENSTVAIFNSVGKMMDQVVVSGTEYIFDISSYAAGIYFVRTGQVVEKFVK
jgi:uncharacterized protein YjdB